ncbi:MAG: TlpA family protein disulfide reductase [Nitrosomonas sp.]|nr:TlpA family protein disulfide reductase [Nitrosomonas sp.]
MRRILHFLYLSVLPVYLLLSTSTMAAQLVDRPVPACNLTALDGVPVDSLQALKGEVLYVDFWASWCPPCIQSFPFLTGLQQEYGERGLRVVGGQIDEKVTQAAKISFRLSCRIYHRRRSVETMRERI